MPRIIVFCDTSSLVAVRLLHSLATAIQKKPGFSIVGIVVPNQNLDPRSNPAMTFSEAGIPIIPLKKDALKDPLFVENLFTELKPDILFNLYCLEIFSAHFLDRFLYTVNYHKGLLPQYRGLCASSWALVMGESQCGYTFHRITPALDAGNILIQSKIKIKPKDRMRNLEQKMVNHASKQMPTLLSMIAHRSEGSEQVGKGRYFSKADQKRITRLASPHSLPANQLVNLCRAFGTIDIRVAKRWFRIKRIQRADPNRTYSDCLYFSSADGVSIEACEFIGMERVRFKLRRAMNRLTGKR